MKGWMNMTNQSQAQSVWAQLSETEQIEVMNYAERYKSFLDNAKTERESVCAIIDAAKEKGFIDMAEMLAQGKTIKSGTRMYLNHKNKAAILMISGKAPLEQGLRIIASHIDAPRLDLKANPLYEDGELALFKTHYYGGIKKYQWTSIPLSLHGIAYRKNGEKILLRIGDQPDEPVFYITDLLPHLGKDQITKPLSDAITAEQLNAVCGHFPFLSNEETKSPIKSNIINHLKNHFQVTEEDLRLAELELVPAENARDVGFDRSLIAAHGQDDRSCAYASLEALLSIEEENDHWLAALFVDKEEIGSVGNTSMNSRFFENILAELLNQFGKGELALRRTLANSKVLSADVTAALDPTFPDVMDPLNSAFIGKGVCISKYTGSRGKNSANDANCEFLQEIRQCFTKHSIIWQVGELGKTDQGGGGTIAYMLAELGAEVVDCGVPMLSMHAPIELTSKTDCYMTMRAYRAFFSN